MRTPAGKSAARLAAAGVLTAAFALAGFSQGADPKLTPGQDPGGTAVAILASGIDYADAAIAKRLARDGEGEIIGYDVVDNDMRPYQKTDPSLPTSGDGTALARSVADIPGTRIVAVRVSTEDPVSVARGAAFAAQTPARIALVPFSGTDAAQWEPLKQVATRAKQLLFLVPAGKGGAPSYPADLGLDNMLAIGGADAGRGLAVEAGDGPLALTAALDRLLGCKGELPGAADGAALKSALLAMAEPANETRKVPLLKSCPGR